MTGKKPRRWAGLPGFEPRRAEWAGPPATTDHSSAERTSVAGAGTLARVAVASAPLPRALVVDDDPEVRRALARFLRPELDVHVAGSVSDARAVVSSLDRLDVAFVDWELPDGTGEQVLEWLSRWPDAIRVLISARFTSSIDALPSPSASGPSVASSFSSSSTGDRVGARDGVGGPAGAPRVEPQLSSKWPSHPLGEASSPKSGENDSGVRSSDNPLKNRALANLVLGKPVATSVIEALKRAALALPHG